MRAKAVDSFRRRLPSEQGWLYDVIDSPGTVHASDPALRPNQLFAYGLPYAPLRGTGPGPVHAVARTLLTPLGLRTLSPADPWYREIGRAHV